MPHRNSAIRSFFAVAVSALVLSGCFSDDVVRARVVSLDQMTRGLRSEELASVNGTYDGCRNRTGAWSIEVIAGAGLDNPELSVVLGDDNCALTITGLNTGAVDIAAAPPIPLTTSYTSTPSAFGVPTTFYANAMLSAVSFSDDFVLTILHSDDPLLASRDNTASPFAPTVISNTPLDGALDRSIATKPTATFSTAMDPATITDLTFIVRRGSATVSGTVNLGGTNDDVATFIPTTALELDTLYEVTISTGAQDLGGIRVAADHTWTFRTAARSEASVVLNSASNFAVLAGATITNTGPTTIIGDMGLFPGVSVTGLPPGQPMGTLYTGGPIAAQAIADLNNAYAEAAGRTRDSILIAGNLGGLTLTPGLYKSTSSLEVSTGDLTFDAMGDGDAVFVFQMATTFIMTPARKIFLTNGAKAANIYWQVGTSATLGLSIVFEGTIMADQSITVNAGAVVNGRVLARIAAVTLDSNTITRPAP